MGKDPDIRIDSNGNWFADGREISHPGIKRYFQRILDSEGEEIFLDDGRQRVKVRSEGFIFFVEAIRERPFKGKPWIWLVINDGTEEPLDVSSLRMLPDNSFVCRIKRGRFEAKFTLSSYWQLVEHIVEKDGRFFLKIGNELFPVGEEG